MTEMRNVDHTHPHTGDPFGFRLERGAAVIADGGEAEAEDDQSTESETMADVCHDTADGAARTYERGTEGQVRNE